MELIALEPMTHATKETVDVCLEDGPCRERAFPAIVDDPGLTSTGGVKMFIDRHPETDEVYDIKHIGSVLAQGSVGEGRAVEEFRQPLRTGEVCDPADRTGVPGTALSTVEGSLHEPAP